MTASTDVLSDLLGIMHDRLKALPGIEEVNAGVIFAVASDGAAFDYVLSTSPTDEAVANLRGPARANLAHRLRDLANRLDPIVTTPPNISAACDVVHGRADALGMEPGANAAVDYRPVLAGTDVDVDELTARSVQYADQVAGELAALPQDADVVDESVRDFIGILAAFWRHACTVGIVAGQRSRR